MTSLFDTDLITDIGNWKDPFPAPVIEEHDGFMVVRDDLRTDFSFVLMPQIW